MDQAKRIMMEAERRSQDLQARELAQEIQQTVSQAIPEGRKRLRILRLLARQVTILRAC